MYRTSSGRLVVLGGFLLLLFIGQELVKLPGTLLLGATVQNALHIPAYALLTLLLAFCFPGFRPVHLLGISLVVGVGLEVLQSFTGRDADLLDVGRNVIGTGIAVLMVRGPGNSMRRWAIGGGLLLIVTFSQPLWVWLAYQHRDAVFPVLLDAGDLRQRPLLHGDGPLEWIATPIGLGKEAGEVNAPGSNALRLCFADVEYPGIHLNEIIADWQGFGSLNVRLMIPGTRSMVITAAVNHRGSPGGAAFVYETFEPGWHQWRVPLDRLVRMTDGRPAQVGKLILHGDRRDAGDCLIVERIWLE